MTLQGKQILNIVSTLIPFKDRRLHFKQGLIVANTDHSTHQPIFNATK